MLKFVKHHMETITGIEIFPLLSLVIFVTFFTAVAIWAFRVNKTHIDKMGNLPLDNNQD